MPKAAELDRRHVFPIIWWGMLWQRGFGNWRQIWLASGTQRQVVDSHFLLQLMRAQMLTDVAQLASFVELKGAPTVIEEFLALRKEERRQRKKGGKRVERMKRRKEQFASIWPNGGLFVLSLFIWFHSLGICTKHCWTAVNDHQKHAN